MTVTKIFDQANGVWKPIIEHRTCEKCQKELLRKPIKHINSNVVHYFCSKKCKIEWCANIVASQKEKEP